MEKERQQQLLSSRSEAAEIIKKTRKKVENRLAKKTLKETTAEVTRLREKKLGQIFHKNVKKHCLQ